MFLIQLFNAVLLLLQMHLEITDSGIIGVQLVPMGGGKPVSYTHLDVYKRQAWRRCSHICRWWKWMKQEKSGF